MSTLVEWMKEVYLKAKKCELEWKPLYPNNMLCNGVDGIYTDMNFRSNEGYQYIKLTIQYQSRCDAEGFSHPEEGTKYYILHSLRIEALAEKIEIPEPKDTFNPFDDDDDSCMVNSYGRFRYAFDDEDTAKKVACTELIQMLYPYTFILSDEEGKEWDEFITPYLEEDGDEVDCEV